MVKIHSFPELYKESMLLRPLGLINPDTQTISNTLLEVRRYGNHPFITLPIWDAEEHSDYPEFKMFDGCPQGAYAIKYLLGKVKATDIVDKILQKATYIEVPLFVKLALADALDTLKDYEDSENRVSYFSSTGREIGKATPGSAAFDLCAAIGEDLIIPSGGKEIVSTGLYFAMSANVAMLLLPRSGNAAKYSVTLANSPGLVDSDYRGEVKLLVINHGKEAFHIQNGDRIAQAMFTNPAPASFYRVADKDHLGNTDRGTGGFGSTGKR